MSDSGGTPAREVDAVAARVIATLDGFVRPLEELAAAVADLMAPVNTVDTANGADAAAATVTEARLQPILPRIQAAIEAEPALAGQGYVAAPGAVSALDRYVLWLSRRHGVISRLRLNFDLGDVDAYDYTAMDWYTGARARGGPVASGPYVDYSGAGSLVVTVAVPVMAGRGFVGIVGADLAMDVVEERLLGELRALSVPAAVVTAERVVVASTSTRWLPGERLAQSPATVPEAYAATAPLGWTGWVLAAERLGSSS